MGYYPWQFPRYVSRNHVLLMCSVPLGAKSYAKEDSKLKNTAGFRAMLWIECFQVKYIQKHLETLNTSKFSSHKCSWSLLFFFLLFRFIISLCQSFFFFPIFYVQDKLTSVKTKKTTTTTTTTFNASQSTSLFLFLSYDKQNSLTWW